MNLECEQNAGGGAYPSTSGPASASSTAGARAKQPAPARRYAFACSNCKRKKIRCGGEKPTCSNCMGALQDSCAYRHQRSVEKELRQAQERIRTLQMRLNEPRQSPSHPLAPNPDSDGHSTLIGDSRDENGDGDKDPNAQDEKSQEAADIFWSQVSVDNQGSPTYHGSTSRFHLEIGRSDAKRRLSSSKGDTRTFKTAHLKALQANSELLKRVWEPLAYAGLQEMEGISPALGSTLLKVYWTWQHPLHNCVYRPCFFRDLALGGPYCSEFLLMSIYALAARHADQIDNQISRLERGERCLQRAKVLLINELSESKPKIPTIQGLLILGGRQCAVGNSSEGWLYTGMAIRMIKDIGLHLNSNSLQAFEGLQPAELESRKRLFFSAYIWDKTISLCLGRPPTLVDVPHNVDDMLDHFDDVDPWIPVYLAGMEEYPSTPGYNTSTFKEFCRIGEIISLLYSAIYSDSKAQCGEEEAEAIEAKLHLCFSKFPDSLRIHDTETIQYCPPPHILSLNLVYHTLLILVWRPFLTASVSTRRQKRAREICSSQSVKINNMFLLYGRTFNYYAMTYLVSYCVYTAATINVYDTKNAEESTRGEVAGRLNISLMILEAEARQTPGVRRSVDIIKSLLSTWDTTTQPGHVGKSHEQQSGTVHAAVDDPGGALYNSYGRISGSGGDAYTALGTSVSDDLDKIMYELPIVDAGGGFQPDVYHWSLNDTWSWSAGQDFGL